MKQIKSIPFFIHIFYFHPNIYSLNKATEVIYHSEIVDGNVKMTLGLIWTIILRFAIQDINVEGNLL